MNNKNYAIGVRNGLLETKHLQALGSSIWLYLWLIDHQPKGSDKVLGGRPIKYEDVLLSFSTLSRITYLRWLKRIEDGGYIKTLRSPYGLIITITKPKKWQPDVSKMQHPDTSKMIQPDVSKMQHHYNKNDTSLYKNDTSNIKETIKETVDNSNNVETQKVYDFYIKAFNKNKNLFKLTPKRKTKIKARLKDAGFDMLCRAIENTAKDSFYLGDNDRGWKADLDFIIRSYEQVERLAAKNQLNSLSLKEAEAGMEYLI